MVNFCAWVCVLCVCVCQEVQPACGMYWCVGGWVSVTAFLSFVLCIVLSGCFIVLFACSVLSEPDAANRFSEYQEEVLLISNPGLCFISSSDYSTEPYILTLAMPCTYQSAFDTLWNSASLEWTRPNMHGGHLAVSFILECRTLITSHNRWFVTQTHLRSRSWKLLEILGRWLDELPVHQSQSSTNFNQSDHQNIWCSMRALPAVPVGKSNSCRRQ